MKLCTYCKENKDEKDFYKDHRTKTGLSSNCISCIKKNGTKWAKKNREKKNLNNKIRRMEIKRIVINSYGGKCACCGEDRIEFLTIDHTNGGGNFERRSLGYTGGYQFYLYLRRKNFPSGYRVLCCNCNCSMGFYGYCPHNS